MATKGKTLRDFITEYMASAKNDQVHRISMALGLDEDCLRKLLNMYITKENYNDFDSFDKLKDTVDQQKAKVFLKK